MTIARIKAGEDPSPTPSISVAELTVADLAERYLKEHAEVHCKPRTKEAYRWLVTKFVLPAVGQARDRRRSSVSMLRLCITGHRETPYQANRILEVVKKDVWPRRGVGITASDGGESLAGSSRSTRRQKRERFLSDHEFRRLGRVLNGSRGGWLGNPLGGDGCPAPDADRVPAERDTNAAVGGRRSGGGRTAAARQQDRRARMVPLSQVHATAVLATLPRDADNPWVIAGKKAGRPSSPTCSIPGGAFARAPNSTTCRIHDLQPQFRLSCPGAGREPADDRQAPGPSHRSRPRHVHNPYLTMSLKNKICLFRVRCQRTALR